MTLSAHQAIAVRRAFPGAEIEGDRIRVGTWRMQLVDGQLTLPSARRLDDPSFDASDAATELWPWWPKRMPARLSMESFSLAARIDDLRRLAERRRIRGC